MRLIEGVLIILIVTRMFSGINKKIETFATGPWFQVALILTFTAHLIMEKPRWQLLPFYVAVFVVLLIYAFGLSKSNRGAGQQKPSNPFLKRLVWIFAGVTLFLSLVLAVLLPVYKTPTPSGDFPVGTESYDLIDPARAGIYSDGAQTNRKIKLQIWYPAETSKGYKRVKWIEDGLPVIRSLAKDMYLPWFAIDQTALIDSHSFKGAPISGGQAQYPVVVISHGWSGFRNLHNDFAEELASNGYIVCGIDHTYGSVATVFDSGEVATVNYQALPKRNVTPDFLTYAEKLVDTYAGDMTLVLDALSDFQDGTKVSKFSGRINLDQIGVMGHSTGGGGAVAVALRDSRVKAVMGLDAWVEPIAMAQIEKGLNVPSLFVRSEAWEDGKNNGHLLPLINGASEPKWFFQFKGSTHYDFSMAYMYSPLTRLMKITGDISRQDSYGLQRELVQNFFDLQLKSGSSDTGNTSTSNTNDNKEVNQEAFDQTILKWQQYLGTNLLDKGDL